MVAHVTIRGVFPPKNVMAVSGDKVLTAIETTLKGAVASQLERAMEKRMRGWRVAPRVVSKFASLSTRFTLLVTPFGSNVRIWRFLTFGVKRHIISVRRAKLLRYRRGYASRTAPGNVYGRSSSYSGSYQYSASVVHPGIEPREFEENIVREEEPTINRLLQAAVARAAR